MRSHTIALVSCLTLSCGDPFAAADGSLPFVPSDAGVVEADAMDRPADVALDASDGSALDASDGSALDAGLSICPAGGSGTAVVVLHDSQGMPPPATEELVGTRSLAFDATVTSVDSCRTMDCGARGAESIRIGLTEPSDVSWTLWVRFPGLPVDVTPGDVLHVESTVDKRSNSLYFVTEYSVLVTRGGELVMFQNVWDLSAFGISLESSGPACRDGSSTYTVAGLRVSFEGESVAALPRQPTRVGSLFFAYSWPSNYPNPGMIPVSWNVGLRLPR